MLEKVYQADLIERLEEEFPGCIVLKNDTSYRQGIPDLSVFYGGRWALLEVKRSANAPEQPNQRWYVEKADKMCFAAFIYPENEEEVINELQQLFKPRRHARLSKP